MRRVGGLVPVSLLGRIRLGGLMFGCLIAVLQLPLLDRAAPAWLVGLGLVGLVGLVVSMVVTEVRGRLVWCEPVLSPILAGLAGIALLDPLTVIGFVMCPLVAQSLWGSNRAATVRLGLLALVAPTVVAVSPQSLLPGGHVWHQASVLGVVPVMLLLGLLVRGVYLLLLRQERGAVLNAVLAVTGRQLLNCRELDEADALVWRTAQALQAETPTICVITGRVAGGELVVDGAAGMPAPAAGVGIPLDLLADLYVGRPGAESTRGGEPRGGELSRVVGGPPHWLAVRSGIHRVMLIGSDRRIPGDVADTFATLGSQAELAEGNCTAHAELVHQARHDQLTELPNRTALFSRLTALVDAANHRATASGIQHVPVATGHDVLIIIDLDDFKQVNDAFGHGAGDELLITIAARLTTAAGDTGLAARFGGDEFALLLTGLADDEDIDRVAERVRRNLREPVRLSMATVTVGASLGLVCLNPGMTAGDHMRCADIAMYSAKARGKNRLERFSPERHGEIATLSMLEDHLTNAIDKREITLEYQPQIDLTTGVCVGVEALVRWHHPTLGCLQPDAFIPLAERTAQIIELGDFILRAACRQAAILSALQGCADLRIAVNVSSRQLVEPAFTTTVADALTETGIPAARLTLELIESDQLSDADVKVRLEELTSIGVRIAIDDFGTGHASLAALCSFPLHQIKIDPVFVDITGGTDAKLELVVSVGRILGLQTIAEGVETQIQHDAVQRLGVSTAQGTYYAAPMPADALTRWLTNQTPRLDPTTTRTSAHSS